MNPNSTTSWSSLSRALLLLALAALTACESTPTDGTGSAYNRRDYSQNYHRNMEQMSTTSGFGSGSGVTPITGYGVGTGGSGWFFNERAFDGAYNHQSR